MTDTKAIVLVSQELEQADPSRLFTSLTAIESFFSHIENTLPSLSDEQLTDLFTLVNMVGDRSWVSRCVILEEIKRRLETTYGHTLSEGEVKEQIAKPLEISPTTVYRDLKIWKSLQALEVEPRLPREFYSLALVAPDFKEAVEHAEEQYDASQGHFTTRQFKDWVYSQKYHKEHEQPQKIVGFDYYGTITHFSQQLAEIASSLKKVYNYRIVVISAFGNHSSSAYEQNCKTKLLELGFFYDEIHTIPFNDESEVPELKLKKCQELGVTIFFDDRADVAELLTQNGIMGLKTFPKALPNGNN